MSKSDKPAQPAPPKPPPKPPPMKSPNNYDEGPGKSYTFENPAEKR